MKKIVLPALALLLNFLAVAQDTAATAKQDTSYWDFGGKSSVTFSQVSLTNWNAGGQNSVSLTTYLGLTANYAKGRTTWENNLDMAYGFIKQGDQQLIKSDDKIHAVSKFGYKVNKDNEKFFFSALIDFRTQFADGFNLPNDSVLVSTFMAPGYLLVTIGMEYQPDKNTYFYLSPLTNKNTFVLDQGLANQGAFGVDAAEVGPNGEIITPGANYRFEAGAYFKFQYKRTIMENVDLETKVDLFSNYIERPENIDVNWETAIVAKVNKYLSANLFTHLIYDDDIKIDIYEGDALIAQRPAVQFKQVFGAGLSFIF